MNKRAGFCLTVFICLAGVLWNGNFSCAQSPESDDSNAVQKISLADAVKLTLSNNIDLKLWEKQIAARELDLDKADFFSKKLVDADESVKEGWQEYDQSSAQLQTLKDLIDQGMIQPGDPLYLTPDQIKDKEEQLNAAREELQDNSQYEVDNLENAQVTELYQLKASLGLNVTKLGVDEARKEYALLTRQDYYQVLKDQRLVSVKQAAAKRAENQYQLAADSYQAGFRAKDDMLMAQAQLSLMKADLVKAKNDLNLAEIELKKVMGLSPDTKIKLEDDFSEDQEMTPLDTGLDQALKNRVEIKKADMEYQVAQVNMELAKRYTAPRTFDYRQIQLDLENARLTLEQEKQSVRGEVYGSYQTVLATSEMLDNVKESVKQAQEALDIATYRYQEGYGIPSSVLKSLNMEDAGGTAFEVLAAQEQLSEVEEKVVEITYSYYLAKSKYQVDICSDPGQMPQ